MPIYEYKCSDCGAHVEKMQKITDEPLKVCEACAGKLEKQWSLSGFQFKGAGWYVTDYSNKSKETNKETKDEKAVGGENDKKAEKTSAADSTAKTESASKETKDSAASSKKETVSKKD